MSRKRTSAVWTKSRNEIQNLLNESSSFVEVLEKLGLCGHSGNHRTLKERIKLDNLNVELLKIKKFEARSQTYIKKSIPLTDVMIENSNYSKKNLKKRLIKENILNYICSKCGNTGSWTGSKLVLQLEHKNGKPTDNRLENLCFLCPNCHSQTETYSGKNSSLRKSRVCVECDGSTKGKGEKCLNCVYQKQKKRFFVEKHELENLVKKFPMTTIGKKIRRIR